ncbi:MAG: TIM barrel protein, partial [Rubripirellula sp.]
PQERAQMVRDLGLERVAYDWRSEHVPTFEEEILQYKQHDIEFFAFWSWHDSLEPLIKKHGIRPQIWMMLPKIEGDDDAERIDAAVEFLRPMVEKTHTLGLRLGLYNHGGWQGEPENLVAICKQLRTELQADHVGIVYNFHHGHDHIERFSEALALMKPHLLCLNINGMMDPESVESHDKKIVPLGEGRHERRMLREVIRQGYEGPIGILDHRNDTDTKEALSANLQGLDQLMTELE